MLLQGPVIKAGGRTALTVQVATLFQKGIIRVLGLRSRTDGGVGSVAVRCQTRLQVCQARMVRKVENTGGVYRRNYPTQIFAV